MGCRQADGGGTQAAWEAAACAALALGLAWAAPASWPNPCHGGGYDLLASAPAMAPWAWGMAQGALAGVAGCAAARRRDGGGWRCAAAMMAAAVGMAALVPQAAHACL